MGDVVQIHEDKYPKSRWTIGVIKALTTGNDGLMRAAIVRTKYGTASQPIVKLYPLEICDTTIKSDTFQPEDRDSYQLGTNDSPRRLPICEAAVCASQKIHEWTTK